MTKYVVHMKQVVIEETWIVVEADDAGEASALAVDKASEAQWSFLENYACPEVVNVNYALSTLAPTSK